MTVCYTGLDRTPAVLNIGTRDSMVVYSCVCCACMYEYTYVCQMPEQLHDLLPLPHPQALLQGPVWTAHS